MKRYFNLAAACLLCFIMLSVFTSCSDWLDVRGENIEKEQDQFESYKGFRDALIGCYMTMGSQNIYGLNLTITDIECLADLWEPGSEYDESAKYYLSKHDYAKDEPKSELRKIYAGLFTTITSANVLLKNLDERGENIVDPRIRAIIEGEAIAIRAYCQLDLLRLFGQMPQGGSKTVKLPYSFTTSIDEQPAYYAFQEYVQLLETDLLKAESLLKDNDPIFYNSYDELNSVNSEVEDDFMYFRQSRLNYWAVRALHARMSLYVGNKAQAHDIAMGIINAKGADSNALVKLSGIADFSLGYNALPTECLFYLSKYDVNTYVNALLIGGNNRQVSANNYYVTLDRLNELYESIPGATASHNRYLNAWNRTAKNTSSKTTPTLTKYWYDNSQYGSSSSNSGILSTKLQIIPMLRLSEMYLIAMETSNSLDEVHALYDTYMYSCSFTLYTPFASLDEARTEMVNEYRREFFGEGQMFYTYKRLGIDHMKWNSDLVGDDCYVLPLPASEYDPAIGQ